MKHLGRISASAEQLAIISSNQMGAELIKGAAGSGKTTTAILRLTSLALMIAARKARVGDEGPVRILLLTFNRTLAGYVDALTKAQLLPKAKTLEISTFASWAMHYLDRPALDPPKSSALLRTLSRSIGGLDGEYVIGEVEYLLGRFDHDRLESYITTERTGRGATPRVDTGLRRQILDKVAYPYLQRLQSEGWLDWNKLALKMRSDIGSLNYDLIVVDESQDFSANEIRAIHHHAAKESAITFVIDTAQRIYARGFSWVEAGIAIAPNRSHQLRENHRNTKEIALFAQSILRGLAIDNDGSIPDLKAAKSNGPLPLIVKGSYSDQVKFATSYIQKYVDLTHETVAFLKPQGGKWFSTLRGELDSNKIEHVELTRNGDWPEGTENVALSTFHSAKGLEFDHVIILGFNQENTEFAAEDASDKVFVLRRLLAVAVARAKRQVILGFKPGSESQLIKFIEPATYESIEL